MAGLISILLGLPARIRGVTLTASSLVEQRKMARCHQNTQNQSFKHLLVLAQYWGVKARELSQHTLPARLHTVYLQETIL